MHNRRDFLIRTTAAIGATVLAPGLFTGCLNVVRREGTGSGWTLVPEILGRIRPPEFPARDFAVTAHGADATGEEDSTTAFAGAIAACHAAGGGRVIVPSGSFLTGPIHLRSNVNLQVDEGATIRFSRDPEAFLPAVESRWEGVELWNYSPFVYAVDAQNVALTGKGVLDGQADDVHWWPWKGKTEFGWVEGAPNQLEARDRLFAMGEAGAGVATRLFGSGDYLRPNMVQFVRCRNVLIEGLTFVRSPMWVLHPVLCENVTVRSVIVDSHGPNNDGCDVESCRDVLIEDCLFDTGDDCVVMKSGRNADGRRVGVPVSNVVIRNCSMSDGHGAVVIGSEVSGGAHSIFAEDCSMDSPNLDRVLRIKTNSVRGGVIEHIYVRNAEVGEVAHAIVSVNLFYEEGDAGPYPPTVRHIALSNITSRKSEVALFLRGYERAPIRDVRLTNCRFENVSDPSVVEFVEDLI
ncbi:MAG TPA: glycoside hydrolase family 28 protein, partial [Rhodothermales bacterium]|nr:glycoside hydrolase family 28 protein [Rhodothermales bacterium]